MRDIDLMVIIIVQIVEKNYKIQTEETDMSECLLDSTTVIKLPLYNSGKVRDIYEIPEDENFLLFVVTDRISAYDVVMEEGIPDKGYTLTQLSLLWFDMMSDIVPNHLVATDVNEYPKSCQPYKEYLVGRSMLVKKLNVLPIECIFRSRLTGSYWHAYKRAVVQRTESRYVSFKEVCGFKFPTNLQENYEIMPPLFTPSTKADLGAHDENVSIADASEIVGIEILGKIRDVGSRIFARAIEYAAKRGVIIADTKFEFAYDEKTNGIYLVDEVLTPDSSRFWPADKVRLGITPPSFDKQFLRDYLSHQLDWNKTYPPPPLPEEIISGTKERYSDILLKLLL